MSRTRIHNLSSSLDGTTFHFLDASPTVVRDFLAAGVVDHAHLVQVPIVLGRGVRLWDGLEVLDVPHQQMIVWSGGRGHPCAQAGGRHPTPWDRRRRREHEDGGNMEIGELKAMITRLTAVLSLGDELAWPSRYS